MKAAVFEGVGKPLRIARVPDPAPEPGELVLRVRACGICGSDLHLSEVHAEIAGMKPLNVGAVMGHEFCGDVVAAAADVRDQWRVGQRVTALPVLSCGVCTACQTGRPHRCAQQKGLGIGAVTGAFAEYVRVSAHQTLALPDSVDDDAGALVEPLAVGLHAVDRARLSAGDNVLVIGAGPVGLATALWCRFFGARHVVLSDFEPSRLERAARLGATGVIDAAQGSVAAAFKTIAGQRPQVVFDCVGVPGSQQHAIDCAPANGRIVIVGVCMAVDQMLPLKAITKELDIVYAYCYQRSDFAFTIDMLAAGRIDPRAMLSASIGFEALPQTFEALKRSKRDCKVLLRPDFD